MRSACVWWMAVLVAPALAQTKPPPLGTVVDSVIATVNDSAILASKVATLVSSRIRGLEAERGPLSPQEREMVRVGEFQALIDRQRLAQSAKSLGPIPPEQIDSILRNETERQRQEQERDFGTATRHSQELKRLGMTWTTMQRDQSIDTLYDIALQISVGRRLQRQTNLLVTPRMLRETYKKSRELFVHDAAATVMVVRFTGPNAAASAEQAAALWRQEDLDARQLAARFPGAISAGENDAAGMQNETISTFALAGPQGAVSAPVPVPDGVLVAKVRRHRPARNGQFEDPAVQLELRARCEREVEREFRAQAMRLARDRTEVWTAPMVR